MSSPRSEAPTAPPVVPFPVEQGEHLVAVGQTRSGKTTLLCRLLTLPMMRYRVILRVKKDEAQYPATIRVKSDPAAHMGGAMHDAIEVFPDVDWPKEKRALVYYSALQKAWRAGSWTVLEDDYFYLEGLGLGPITEDILTLGAAKKLSMWTSMQRPARVTRFAYSEVMHFIAFAGDGRDAKTIAESTVREMEDAVLSLGRHEFAWYYKATRAIWIGRLDKASGELAGMLFHPGLAERSALGAPA